MKIQYMGREYEVLSKCSNEHKIPFDRIYTRTSNRNCAVGVTLHNNVVNLIKLRKEVTLGDIMLYYNLDNLYSILSSEISGILDIRLYEVQPCIYISEKRSREQIIDQLIYDNQLDPNNIITKYKNVLCWYNDTNIKQ